jgi:hypothetical protein
MPKSSTYLVAGSDHVNVCDSIVSRWVCSSIIGFLYRSSSVDKTINIPRHGSLRRHTPVAVVTVDNNVVAIARSIKKSVNIKWNEDFHLWASISFAALLFFFSLH